MRLPEEQMRSANIFWPFLRASKRTGWWGFVYRLLERTAPITRCSPVRRAIQIVCLILFVYAFFYVCWPYSQHFSETTFSQKEYVPAELFLLIDPLVGLSTALAGRIVNATTLWWTVAIILFCVLVPRAFCGYFCPLGTLFDAFDWLIGRRFKRFYPTADRAKGGWFHLKYYVLAGVLASSSLGILSAGFFSAIPVLTRGLLFTGARLQLLAQKGPSHLSPADWTLYLSVALFVISFLVSFWGRRFWCRYVCPTGALLSALSVVRVGERKLTGRCTSCRKCVDVCPFHAIKQDFTTRTSDCTYCQTCGGVCPTGAIRFVSRWHDEAPGTEDGLASETRPVSRRGFVAASLAGAGYAALCRLDAAHGGLFPKVPDHLPEPNTPLTHGSET